MATNKYTACAARRSITNLTRSTTQNNTIQRDECNQTEKIATRHHSRGLFPNTQPITQSDYKTPSKAPLNSSSQTIKHVIYLTIL